MAFRCCEVDGSSQSLLVNPLLKLMKLGLLGLTPSSSRMACCKRTREKVSLALVQKPFRNTPGLAANVLQKRIDEATAFQEETRDIMEKDET